MEGAERMSLVVAYPGTEGSFTCAAARSAFPDAELHAYTTFQETAKALTDWKADYALLPIENSFAGAVITTYSLLERLPIHIVGEVTRDVHHQLLGVPGARLEDIRVISSHPQAISQCDAFLGKLKDVQVVPSENTALSAREVAELGDKSRAAIASKEAMKTFGLELIAENIESSANNTTRFFVLSMDSQPLATPDKATVVFTVVNEVGALAKLLTSFAESGLNMTRIESRPIPETPFRYFFTADFEGPMERFHLRLAMEAARKYTNELRLIGTYPKAVR